MYISKSKTKYGTHYISICKGIRDPETKKSKKIMVKSFGTHDLNSKAGKSALKVAEKELEEMLKFEEAAKEFQSFRDFVEHQELSLKHKNIGFLPYLNIFNDLKLPNFFKSLSSESKLEYNHSDMMFYQVLGRLFNPSSKHAIVKRKDDFLYDFSFVNKDNIYSSLDVFSGFNKYKSQQLTERIEAVNNMKSLLDTIDEEAQKILEQTIDKTILEIKDLTESYDQTFEKNEKKLFKHLNKYIEKIIPDRNLSFALYDCTTYYFESFTEDELRERGMSKDNKRNETQVVMGLLVDADGIPISYKLFRGNEHELYTMEKVIDDVLNNYEVQEIIIIADRGLNSKKNLKMIRDKGLNYIVGSKGTSAPKKLRERKFDATWNSTNATGSKYRSGFITETRVASYEGESYEELIIKKYSDLYKEREIIKQAKTIENAKKNLKDFTVNATTKSKSRYYVAADNGKEKISVTIDEKKIKAEQANFGYFYIVTNKLDMNPVEIMKAYRSLYKIEESFRVLKSNFKARPVYHFRSRRVRSHFLICYIALVLQRLLEYKLAKSDIKLSTHEIMVGLSSFMLDEIDYKIDKLYMLSDKQFNSDINKNIFKLSTNVLFTNTLEKQLKNCSEF